MRQRRFLVFIAATVLLPMMVGSDALAASTHCLHGWRAFPLPNEASLVTADAVSRSDVWAAGDHFTGTKNVPVVEHFDGSGWSRVPVPMPSRWTSVDVRSIEFRAGDDGWLGGGFDDATGEHALLMHWDGHSWYRVGSPGDGAVWISAISATGANGAWAVGTADDGGLTRGVAMHWDGFSWSDSPLPDQALQWKLESVTALAPGDVWAGGTLGGTSLMLHWDGETWTQVSTPPATDQQAPVRLYSIVGTADDLWAYGSSNEDLCCERGYSMHWDGATWTEEAAPRPIWDADANGADKWTVEGFGGEAYVAHFDGSAWTYSSPRLRTGPGLFAVAAVPSHVWVFGAIRLSGAPNWAVRSC
jgi:hypothetical protein